MPRLRVLTFNFHEPYLCLMAKTGLDLTVGQYSQGAMARAWHNQYRSIPSNITIVDEKTWREDLQRGRFDVVVTHNESNAVDLFHCTTPKILICHNRRTFLETTASVEPPKAAELFDRLLARLQERYHFVFISDSKRDDYRVPGTVIYPGLDVEEYGGYTGEINEVLRVGNVMRDRNRMFDVDFQEQVCEGYPNRIVGVNPKLPQSQESRSFEELLGLYRTRRCYLHVTRQEYEDGYNLALLEAMACGSPAVSLANRTSPITDGVDGFTSFDAELLRRRIRELFDDAALARAIGAKGRETVASKFPLSAFVDSWRRVLEEAAEGKLRHQGHSRVESRPQPAVRRFSRLLLSYTSSPYTTGRYIERAARKSMEVVTAGPRLPEGIMKEWGFSDIPAYPTHEIDLTGGKSFDEVFSRLPADFAPDLFLFVDSGTRPDLEGISKLQCPKACYLIDTHVNPEPRIEIASHFDFTFLAQKAQVEMFRKAGIPNVHWLPLGCSPELHDLPEAEREFDVVFVGSIDGDASGRRRRLLDKVTQRFPNSRVQKAWPEEMASLYGRAKVAINTCVRRDVNMRVFEAMASGALLVTDEADGLEDLFEDGRHLAVYRSDDEMLDVIARYLDDEEARTRIAREGAALVRSQHSYDQRLQTILDVVQKAGTAPAQPGSAVNAYYRSTRPEVAQFVPAACQRLLDVGCGAGDFGRTLKQSGVKEVHGIEIVEDAWKMAQQQLDSALRGNIEQMELPFKDGYFDCVTFSDVLEHLVNPGDALKKAARVLAPDGCIIMSIPNVRFYQVVAMLANGRWKYEDAGILDRTHLRFFTRHEIHDLIEEAGLELLELTELSYATEEQLPRNPDGSVTLGRATYWPVDEQDYKELRVYQYLAIAGKPGGDRLAKARATFETGQYEASVVLAQQARGVNNAERRRIMARAFAFLGQLTQAESVYRDGLTEVPDDAELQSGLGILLVAMNRLEEARALLQRALTLDPNDDRATGALGMVYTMSSEHGKALELLMNALDSSYDNVSLLTPLAVAAEAVGRMEEAEPVFARFADFHAGNFDVALQHAVILVKLKRYEDARNRLDTILMMAPGHAQALELLEWINREASA